LTTRKNTRPAGDSRAGVNDRKGDTKLTKIAKDTKARLRRAANPKRNGIVIIWRAERALGVLGVLCLLRVGS